MRSIKCVVIGDGAVGKTSLLISYTTNTFPQDYVPTVFDNYTTTISLKDPNVIENSTNTSVTTETHSGPTSTHSNEHLRVFKLNLWDTAGQEEYDRLRPLSYPQTDIFLICFAITEKNSFRNVCDKWLPELKLNSNIENNSLFTNFNKLPILLVGTKSDLEGTISETDPNFISKEEIDKCVQDNGFMGYVECSAMTQVGVREIFEKAIDVVVFEPERLSLKQKKNNSLNNAFSGDSNSNTNNNNNTANNNNNDKFKLLDHHHHHHHHNHTTNASSPANNVITNSSNNNSNSSTNNKEKQTNNNNSQGHSHSHHKDKQSTTTTNGNTKSSSSKRNKKKKDKCIIM